MTYCDSSDLHRSLQTSSPQCVEPLVWSSTAGSFLITLCVCVCCVSTDEFDLAAVSSGSSQRAVFHGLVVHIMSLLLAVPISLDAFRDFAKRLRTCAQPLSVGVWHLGAARFVMGSVSARLNGTDVFVCRSTSYCRVYHESGCLFTEEVFRSVRCPWQRRNGVQLFLLCVKFSRNCHRRHFDLCCGVCVFFSPPILPSRSVKLMTPLPEKVFDNAKVSENRLTVLWRHIVFVAAANFQISGGMRVIWRTPRRASHRQDERVQLRTAGCSAMCSCTAFLGCNFEFGLRNMAFVRFFVGLNRQGTDMWQNWFRFRMPGALVDLLSLELLASFLADFFVTVRWANGVVELCGFLLSH